MRRLATVIAILTFMPMSGQAQETTGGFLFSYSPHPEEREAFEAGYRRHLDWHRTRADSLPWFGWDVLAGPRLGMFIDGTFGMQFAALDERVDPRGDAADAATTFQPHAEPSGRELVLLRRDLSTATPLEDGAPSRFVQVVRFRVSPAEIGRAAHAFNRLRGKAEALALLPYTVYEVLAGASPGFLLMVWRDGLGTFDATDRNPEAALREYFAEAETGVPTPIDADVASEVWMFRPDLTYTGPEEDE